ncbi:MAG: motility associated factor glycosyltransferase family protein [Brevinema sp.]
MELIKKLSELQHPSLIATPDGAFTIQLDNKFIHSSRAPLKESSRLLQDIKPTDLNKTIVILWGVGLGYHAETLLNQGYKIIAIEPRPELAEIFKRTFPIDKLVDFIENDPEDLFNALARLNPSEAQIFIDIVMPTSNISPNFFKMAEQGKNVPRSTHRIYSYLIDSWHKNILTNISRAEVTFSPLFQDQEVIICSAGPSLKESLPHLKRLSSQMYIIAVDTALKSLLEAGIVPDYVFSVDAKIHNISDFCGISNENYSKMILLADITLNPQIASLPWKKVFFTTTVQPITSKDGTRMHHNKLLNFFTSKGFHFPELQTGGSVANTAFHAALFYQAKKVLLVGQDLAYTDNRGHAIGSPYDQEYRLKTNRLNTIETIQIKKVPFQNEVKAILNGITYSDELLMQFRSWFETSLANNKDLAHKTINASENGAYFEHWTHHPLSKYTTKSLKKVLPIAIEKFDEAYIKECFDFFKKQDLVPENTDPIIAEYFYREFYGTSSAKHTKQKIKNLKKIIGG